MANTPRDPSDTSRNESRNPASTTGGGSSQSTSGSNLGDTGTRQAGSTGTGSAGNSSGSSGSLSGSPRGSDITSSSSRPGMATSAAAGAGTMGSGSSTSIGSGSTSGTASSMAGSGGSGTTSTAGATGASGTSANRASTSMGAGSTSGTGEGADIVGQGNEDNSGPGPRLMTASTLEGDKVVNRQGEDLGEIDEIMIDVPRGRIAYAVMSSGGFLGMGDKLFAIPWSALTLDTDNKCFVLDCDKQRLESAPGFDKDHWPSMADQEFGRQVHTYYKARPYWE